MKKRFFGTIFGGKTTEEAPAILAQSKNNQSSPALSASSNSAGRSRTLSIKPANDILDFQYPPQSPFFKTMPGPVSDDAGELHPNM